MYTFRSVPSKYSDESMKLLSFQQVPWEAQTSQKEHPPLGAWTALPTWAWCWSAEPWRASSLPYPPCHFHWCPLWSGRCCCPMHWWWWWPQPWVLSQPGTRTAEAVGQTHTALNILIKVMTTIQLSTENQWLDPRGWGWNLKVRASNRPPKWNLENRCFIAEYLGLLWQAQLVPTEALFFSTQIIFYKWNNNPKTQEIKTTEDK